MADQKIYKPRPVTGFPEWLPEVRRIEQRWMDHIRKTFESNGFCSIETPSVEELDVLGAKGEIDKEIYVLERLHKDEIDKSDARLGLHLTRPFPSPAMSRNISTNWISRSNGIKCKKSGAANAHRQGVSVNFINAISM